MAIHVTTLGTNSNTAGATLLLTSKTVPAGSLIVVLIDEGTSTSTNGSVTDGAGNTYVVATSGQNNNTGNNNTIFYCKNCLALTAQTITYTKQTSGAVAAISAIYATGVDTSSPLDTAVTASQVGNSASVSVTSGTPSVPGELLVGIVGLSGTSPAFTRNSDNGWATPPTTQTSGAAGGNVSGASFLASGTDTSTLVMSVTSGLWFAAIVGFKPATVPAIACTKIGTNTDSSSAATVALSSVTVPRDSLIVVIVTEAGTTGIAGALSDGVNTYSLVTSGQHAGTGSLCQVYYAAGAALTSGTITYTKHAATDNASISAFYATNVAHQNPLDASVTASKTGTSAAPTALVSGTPTIANELLVAISSVGSTGTNTTQDLADDWGSPPAQSAAGGANIAGGTQISTTSTVSLAPTYSASQSFFLAIIGFRPFIPIGFSYAFQNIVRRFPVIAA